MTVIRYPPGDSLGTRPRKSTRPAGHLQPAAGAPREGARGVFVGKDDPPLSASGCCRGQLRAATAGETARTRSGASEPAPRNQLGTLPAHAPRVTSWVMSEMG